VKDQELNPRPHTPRPAALPVKVDFKHVRMTFDNLAWRLPGRHTGFVILVVDDEGMHMAHITGEPAFILLELPGYWHPLYCQSTDPCII